jgi:predicted RNase H-like nuclease (RuvC/YqgF family)
MNPDTSPSKTPKVRTQDKQNKLLTNMVQALAEKLKKRDRKVHRMQEKADDLTLQLESAQERLVDAAAENQNLTRRVKNLQSTINMQDVEEINRWNKLTDPNTATPTATTTPTRHIDEAEFRKVRLQRDSATIKAGEMSVALAESRAETDELRDQLAALSTLMIQQRCRSVPASPASVIKTPTSKALKKLSFLSWQSPKAPGHAPLLDY